MTPGYMRGACQAPIRNSGPVELVFKQAGKEGTERLRNTTDRVLSTTLRHNSLADMGVKLQFGLKCNTVDVISVV